MTTLGPLTVDVLDIDLTDLDPDPDLEGDPDPDLDPDQPWIAMIEHQGFVPTTVDPPCHIPEWPRSTPFDDLTRRDPSRPLRKTKRCDLSIMLPSSEPPRQPTAPTEPRQRKPPIRIMQSYRDGLVMHVDEARPCCLTRDEARRLALQLLHHAAHPNR
jgi:hypothetical protein